MERYPCACCGYKTLPEEPPGTFYICHVCGWEDDAVQFDDPDYEGGANAESLRQAQRKFRSAGEKGSKSYVRAPKPEEARDPGWKFLE